MNKSKNTMNNQEYHKLTDICEAVVIVEGLKMLINRIDIQYQGYKDQEVYQATIGFLQYVHSKYSTVASCQMTKDQEGNIIPEVITPNQLIRSAAQDYIKQSMN